MKNQKKPGAIILLTAVGFGGRTEPKKKKKTKQQLAFEIKDLAQEVRHLANTNRKATREELVAAHTQLQIARFHLQVFKNAQTLSIPK
jgi:outer membrane murein-binding lipoprotein Lpp